MEGEQDARYSLLGWFSSDDFSVIHNLRARHHSEVYHLPKELVKVLQPLTGMAYIHWRAESVAQACKYR